MTGAHLITFLDASGGRLDGEIVGVVGECEQLVRVEGHGRPRFFAVAGADRGGTATGRRVRGVELIGATVAVEAAERDVDRAVAGELIELGRLIQEDQTRLRAIEAQVREIDDSGGRVTRRGHRPGIDAEEVTAIDRADQRIVVDEEWVGCDGRAIRSFSSIEIAEIRRIAARRRIVFGAIRRSAEAAGMLESIRSADRADFSSGDLRERTA